jgi:hypothetical protein
MRTYLLRFQEDDGSVTTDVLYRKKDDAGLVGPDGTPLSTTESFAMTGREWRIVDVHVTETVIRILCVTAASSSEGMVRASSVDSAAS